MLTLTPDMLAACYDFLRTTKPFSGWKLPPSTEVVFHVSKSKGIYGEYNIDDDGTHRIDISCHRHAFSSTLLATMAHEMIHLYQEEAGTASETQHNANFLKVAAKVCRIHGFDPKIF